MSISPTLPGQSSAYRDPQSFVQRVGQQRTDTRLRLSKCVHGESDDLLAKRSFKGLLLEVHLIRLHHILQLPGRHNIAIVDNGLAVARRCARHRTKGATRHGSSDGTEYRRCYCGRGIPGKGGRIRRVDRGRRRDIALLHGSEAVDWLLAVVEGWAGDVDVDGGEEKVLE